MISSDRINGEAFVEGFVEGQRYMHERVIACLRAEGINIDGLPFKLDAIEKRIGDTSHHACLIRAVVKLLKEGQEL